MKPAPLRSRGGRVHLLVVDEMEPLRETLALLFEQAGYEVETAADGAEALQLTQLMRWDAVVLDFDLPGMNGAKLYARILLEQRRPRLPAVFMSSRALTAQQLGLHGAHWIRLVDRPCRFPELLRSLEECLRADGESGKEWSDPGVAAV